MSNQQSLREYLVSRIAELRKQATNRPKNESFTPYNLAILELEQVFMRLANITTKIEEKEKEYDYLVKVEKNEMLHSNYVGRVLTYNHCKHLLKGKTCPACNTNHKGECPNAHGSWE